MHGKYVQTELNLQPVWAHPAAGVKNMADAAKPVAISNGLFGMFLTDN